MYEGRILLDDGDNMASKVGVTACELVCKGGKDVFELPSVEVITGTEKAGTEDSFVGECFRERLGYCRFPSACQSV